MGFFVLRSVNQRRVSGCSTMPLPRPSSTVGVRSKMVTSKPASRSSSAVVRPPMEPPMTMALAPE